MPTAGVVGRCRSIKPNCSALTAKVIKGGKGDSLHTLPSSYSSRFSLSFLISTSAIATYIFFAPLDSSPESEEMTLSKTGTARGRGKGTVQATLAADQKWKRADANEEPKKREANESADKWFPSTASKEDLKRLRAKRSSRIWSIGYLRKRARHRLPPASVCSTMTSLATGLGSRCTSLCVGSYTSSAANFII